MAAGAVELRAEKNPADRDRFVLGLSAELHVEEFTAGLLGQEQLFHPAVIRDDAGELLGEPGLETVAHADRVGVVRIAAEEHQVPHVGLRG